MAYLKSETIITEGSQALPIGGKEGMLGYAAGDGFPSYYDGTLWQPIDAGGGGGNSFETINCDNGTDPVADSSSDTLNLVSSAPIVVTGDSSTDTVTFAAKPHYCVLERTSATTSGGAGVATYVDFDTVINDPYALQTAGNDIAVDAEGVWACIFTLNFAGNVTGAGNPAAGVVEQWRSGAQVAYVNETQTVLGNTSRPLEFSVPGIWYMQSGDEFRCYFVTGITARDCARARFFCHYIGNPSA